jgi:hypothetical protein
MFLVSLPSFHALHVHQLLIATNVEWLNTAVFHDFFPTSSKFQAFAKMIGAFVATKPVPEIYEAQERSTACLTAPLTQIIKVKAAGKGVEEAWEKLVSNLEAEAVDKPYFYHASGLEKDEGVFLGLIGWHNLQVSWDSRANDTAKKEQDQERASQCKNVGKQVQELGGGEEVQNIVARLTAIKIF